MRYPSGHHDKTHARIRDAAGRLFRARGYVGTGLHAVMQTCGLTVGGFYAQFPSKDALFGEIIDELLTAQGAAWRDLFPELTGPAWVRKFVALYLSAEHRDHPEAGCPLPSLAGEIARLGVDVRTVTERHLRDLMDVVSRKVGGRNATARGIALVALAIGGLTLARAVADRERSDRILAACREAASRLAGAQ